MEGQINSDDIFNNIKRNLDPNYIEMKKKFYTKFLDGILGRWSKLYTQKSIVVNLGNVKGIPDIKKFLDDYCVSRSGIKTRLTIDNYSEKDSEDDSEDDPENEDRKIKCTITVSERPEKEVTILDFVSKAFDNEYPINNCPKWVNYTMFRNDMISKLTKSLTDSATDSETTEWNSLMHVPFTSKSYDTGADSNWHYFNQLEIEIPPGIIKSLEDLQG
jgi:hypothetical protein